MTGLVYQPMRVWITEIGEPLPLENDARLLRYGQLTRMLASHGHAVTWWTSNFSHYTKTFVVPGDADRMVDGVRLRVLAGPGYSRNVSIDRLRHQGAFARRFALEIQREPQPDIILTPIPTLEVASAAVRFAKGAGVPVVVDIRDEWPDEFVRLAPAGLRWAAKLFFARDYARARYSCRNAEGILGISQRQLDWGLRLAGRPAGANDALFPHGYSPEPVDDDKLEAARGWWREHGLRPGAFVVCFFGTIGKFFDLSTVIQAARMLERELDIQFVICGDGSERERFMAEAKDSRSVMFPGWIDAPRISALMEAASAGLAPYRADADVFSLPNKPFEYLAGRLPVISSIQGELRQVLAEHRCGLSYRGDNAGELAACVRQLHADPKERRAMGARGRELILRDYAMPVIQARMEQHLLNVIDRAKRARQGQANGF